jgi:hypothetical protein
MSRTRAFHRHLREELVQLKAKNELHATPSDVFYRSRAKSDSI